MRPNRYPNLLRRCAGLLPACAAALMAGTISCSLYGSWDLLGLLSTQYLSRGEVTEPGNWVQIQDYLNWLASQGVAGPPTVDTSTMSGLDGDRKWYGGVLAPNGKIYGVPFNASNVLIVDPSANTAETPISVPEGDLKWVGGVLAPNGKIYCVPFDADNILVINPATDPETTSTIDPIPSGDRKWAGGVLAGNGKIYCVPSNSESVLVIDPAADIVASIDLPPGPPDPAEEFKWYGGVLAPDGRIFCIPWSTSHVMIIDPRTDPATIIPDAIAVSAAGDGDLRWIGGVLAPNGKIYAVPRDADRVLIIDPKSNTPQYIMGLPVDENKWAGAALAPDGKIYCLPHDQEGILVVDPRTSAADPSGVLLPPGPPVDPTDENKWTSGVLAPNGSIYGMPSSAESVLKLDVRSNGEVFASIAESAYFNKF